MNQNGAVDLESINVNASANHGDCTLFALLAAIDFFQGQFTPVSTENAIAKTASLQVFPNPAQDFVHVLGIEHSANIDIYSVSGQLIYRSIKEANDVLDLSTLREGIYYLKVSTQMQTEIHPIQIIR